LLNIPWITVADLLLSNLCDEVGHELYEMDVAVRNELLKQLKEDPRFGEKRINELSNFLLAYVRKDLNSSESDRRDFAQSQRWTALAYKDSEQAVRELALAFNQAYNQDRAELVRLATLTEILAQPVEEFEKLLIYARAMGHYARKRLEDAKNQVSSLSIKGRLVSISGVDLPIPLELIADEVEKEQKRHLLWQQGNTRIYSFCTDEPWTLPFDALVIPSGYRISFGGQFERSFIRFLGDEIFSYLNLAINKAKDENKQAEISPDLPLLVPVPSEIQSTFSKRDAAGSDFWLVFATVEDLIPSVYNAFQATQSIILKTADKGITRLVLPLLGTGNNCLPITKVAIAMLSALTESLNNLSSNPIKEIIFVDKKESTIDIINQVALSLFAQKNIDDVQLLSAQGIDYTQLRDLLAAGKWKEADQETAKVILQASGQEERGWLDKEDMEKIPSIDLQTIDQLWVKYSNGKFGFSVQKQIYQSLGGTKEFNQKITEAFWHKVGLIINNEPYWSQYDNLTFNLSAPIGHLPIRYDVDTPAGVFGVIESLFSRPDLEIKNTTGANISINLRDMNRDALVVGINRYPFLSHLSTAAFDAEAIAQILEQYGNFQVRRFPHTIADSTLQVDINTTVTAAELENAITQLFLPNGNNIPDTALLFFAGHGLRRQLENTNLTEGYLATSDASPRKEIWGISLKWLRKLLRKSPVRQQIVWLDCCNSGELFNFTEDDLLDESTKQCFFITASRGFESAYSSPYTQHGALTEVLLKGLDPTRNSEGLINNFTLTRFIEDNLRQTPQRVMIKHGDREILLTFSE
jgi:hypothetical protein